jgi:hypothetical protein
MKFTPKTEKEIKELNLLPEGYYNFEVMEAKDVVSQNGNQMISLVLRINFNHKERKLFDNLMEAFEFKLRSFCYAVGLQENYEQGNLEASDCMKKYGRIKVVIAPEKTVKGKTYKSRNEVEEYFVFDDSNASETGIIDDDIKF